MDIGKRLCLLQDREVLQQAAVGSGIRRLGHGYQRRGGPAPDPTPDIVLEDSSNQDICRLRSVLDSSNPDGGYIGVVLTAEGSVFKGAQFTWCRERDLSPIRRTMLDLLVQYVPRALFPVTGGRDTPGWSNISATRADLHGQTGCNSFTGNMLELLYQKLGCHFRHAPLGKLHLEQMERGWTPFGSDQTQRPLPGDVYAGGDSVQPEHPNIHHVGIVYAIDSSSWIHLDGGQANPDGSSQSIQWFGPVPFPINSIAGWLDIDKYFGFTPAATH